MRPLAISASDWAALLAIPTAVIAALVGPWIQRKAQQRRDAVAGSQNYVGQLIAGYEGRIKDLRDQITSDKLECQAEIAAERREREQAEAQIRADYDRKVREASQQSDIKVASLERQLEDWRRYALRTRRRDTSDDTPPPENKP